jgi:hypothetical protein
MPILSQSKLIIAIATIVVSFGAGWKVHSWKTDAAEKARVEEQLALKEAYDVLSREVVKKYNEKEAKTVIEYRTIKGKIDDVTDNRICFADNNALSLWNNALNGVSSTPTGTTEETTRTSATDKEVITNAIENFEQYKQARDQLNSLIDWYELHYNSGKSKE